MRMSRLATAGTVAALAVAVAACGGGATSSGAGGTTSGGSSAGPSGTLVVETLLQLPGIGYQLISSINQDDYTVVQGIALVVAVAVVLINFCFDFLFTVVDPRIARD